MDLLLFDQLEKLGRDPTIYVASETMVFDRYDQLIKARDKMLVIAHCRDEVIVSRGLRTAIPKIERDLTMNPNLHLILISCYDISEHLPRNPRFQFIHFPEYHGVYWDLYKDIEPTDPAQIKCRFLSLNKRADPFRQALYYKFYKLGLIQDNIFSYLSEDMDQGTLFHEGAYQRCHSELLSIKGIEDLLSDPPVKGIGINDDVLLSRYGVTKKREFCWQSDQQWYNSSFCSIVIETDARDRYPNLSEKTFRCITLQHPLLLFATPAISKTLDLLGLDLGPTMQGWDHDRPTRFKHFLDHIDTIANTSIPDLIDQRREMQWRLVLLRREYSRLHGRIEQRQSEIMDQVINQKHAWGF